MIVKIKKLDPSARIPEKQSEFAACYDIFSLENVTVFPGQLVEVRTGISIQPPTDYVAHLYPRSSMGKNDLSFPHSLGIIDPDYTGELRVLVKNNSDRNHTFKRHARVAQIGFHKIENVIFSEVTSLDETDRADGGFGSTGE